MMNYLNDKTREIVINSSDKERIHFTQNFSWIGYTQSINVFKKLDDLKNYPKIYRMPNLLLIGESNNGKTAILRKYSERNEAYVRESDSQIINPVIYVQAPPEPDEKRFYNIILDNLFAPSKTTEKIDSRQQRVIHLLKRMETKVLMIDEIHHVLAGSTRKQRSFLNVIKFLSNELQIPIVCAGTKDAFNAIQTDPQLSNRFEPKILPRWTNDLEYKRLLLSFEKILPLKKESMLIENSIADNILNKSDGLIGEISKILELSCIQAIETGKERIDNHIINSIDYIPPAKRRKQILY